MCRAFQVAGADPTLMHLDALLADPAHIHAFQLIGFPGGFSYGDDIASGRLFAMKVRERLFPTFRESVARGTLIIGACNGFQVLVQAGLLPGPDSPDGWSHPHPPIQSCALTDNLSARFTDRWVGMEFDAASKCVWTRGLATPPVIKPASGQQEAVFLGRAEWLKINQLPVAHGEGRFVTGRPGQAETLARQGQVPLRYTDNYNGSDGAIAGICDATGRVFGLMPHPERYLEWTRHPYWTRLPAHVKALETPGLRMFKNAVEAAGA
jgi:phosphoribosylformylglycinamidine synthase